MELFSENVDKPIPMQTKLDITNLKGINHLVDPLMIRKQFKEIINIKIIKLNYKIIFLIKSI